MTVTKYLRLAGLLMLFLLADGCTAPLSGDATVVGPDLGAQPQSMPFELRAITPEFGPTVGGILIQIDGDGFVGGATVRIGSAMASQVTVISSKRIIAVLPPQPGAWGKVLVVVTFPDGRSVSSDRLFGYYADKLDFIVHNPIPIDHIPYTMLVADLNNDRRSDLVTGGLEPDLLRASLRVKLGAGSGTFHPTLKLDAGSQLSHLAVGDFNNDKNLDLVRSAPKLGQLTVIFGDGTGGFKGTPNTIGGGSPDWISVCDFNGDQQMDLAVTNRFASTISLLLGDGQGGFFAPTALPVRLDSGELVVGDFNGDQRPDLAVGQSQDYLAAVLLGNSIGGFSDATYYSTLGSSNLLVSDPNGDRKADLIAFGGIGVMTASVLLGDGAGGFSLATDIDFSGIPGAVQPALVAEDFNGDQRADLAIVTQNSITIMLGNGTGRFVLGRVISVSTGDASILAVGDLAGNPRPDLILATRSPSQLIVLENQSW